MIPGGEPLREEAEFSAALTQTGRLRSSFRFQLALRAAFALVVGLVALSAVTVWALGVILDRELNASILGVASIQAGSLADGPEGAMRFHEWDLTPAEAASLQDLIRYAQVWRADGKSLLRSQFMTADLPLDRAAVSRSSGDELVWVEGTFQGIPIRSLFYPLERLGPAHETHVLQVAAPLVARDEMVARVGTFFGVLILWMGAVGFAGSWWLAGRAVRPVHQVIDQAEEISVGSLGRGIRAYADTSEVRRLVDVLNTMLSRIRTAFDAQRRFTADASHELRSPLTAMRGEIELALRRERSNEEYAEVLRSTLEEVNRLSGITENLLTLARSDAGALRPQPESLDAVMVVSRVVERLRAQGQERGVRLDLSVGDSVPCEVDPGILSQIVWNLVENGLKFTPSGGSVSVAVHHSGDVLKVVVDDSGPGLGEMSGSPFDRFSRADQARTPDSDTAGAGLGLAIVKALVDLQEGAVTASDRPEGGARFIVAIPAKG